MSLSFTIVAGRRQRCHSQVRVPRDSWPHLTVSDWRLPQPGGSGPRIYIPRNWLAQLYPQVLGSLLVASYDWQSYGGGIRPHLHTAGFIAIWSPLHGPRRKHCFQQFPYCCARTRCRGNLFVLLSLPSDGSTCYNIPITRISIVVPNLGVVPSLGGLRHEENLFRTWDSAEIVIFSCI
jgi:hypothetical protein